MPAPMTVNRLKNPHMRTTRVRSIAAAARGSTLVMPLNQSIKQSNNHTLSPINLPWATLMSTNSNYPSIDIIEDGLLIGRKPPCQLIVNHQAISGIHCRLVRKPTEQSIDQMNSPVISPSTSQTNSLTPSQSNLLASNPTSPQMSAITEDEENDEDEDMPSIKQSNNLSINHHHHRTKTMAQTDEPESKEHDDQSINQSPHRPLKLIDEKLKRKSRIHVKDMVSIFGGQSHGDQEDDDVVWKGSKNQSINQSINQSRHQIKSYEVWLEDLSTNGTFINQPVDQSINQSASLTKIGSGNSMRLSTGSEFTILPSNSSNLSAISFVLRIHGESPVGTLIDEAPSDSVAMVFTDIESSTNLWAADPIGMNSALEEHDRTLRTLLSRFRGYEVKTEGDAFMVAFHTVLEAVKWCLAVQEAFLRTKWPDTLLELPSAKKVYINDAGEQCSSGRDDQLLFSGLRVRMGIHVGHPNCRRNPTTKRMDYFGPMVNLSARVSDAGHGGQIVCTQEVCRIVELEVARMKEKAEKEWAEERDEDGTDEEEEETNNQSISQTYNPDKVMNQSSNQPPSSPLKSPRMDPTRYARIKDQLIKRPTTLDNTLDHLTDLNAVTFVDCGSVELKGITGPTRVYQISSVNLSARRWEPALRAKPAAAVIDQTIELGSSAPVPPPLSIELTFYTKHNIPLQIRRAIIKNKKEENEMKGIKSTSKRSSEKSVNQSINQSIKQSVNPSVSQTSMQVNEQSINQSTDQPMKQSNNQPTKHTAFLEPVVVDDLNATIPLDDMQSIGQSKHQSNHQSTDQPDEQSSCLSITDMVNQAEKRSSTRSNNPESNRRVRVDAAQPDTSVHQPVNSANTTSNNLSNNQVNNQSNNQPPKRRSGSSALAASILAARAINQSTNQPIPQVVKSESLQAPAAPSKPTNQQTSRPIVQPLNRPTNPPVTPSISYASVVRSAPGSRISSPVVKASVIQPNNQSISPMMSSRSIKTSSNESLEQTNKQLNSQPVQSNQQVNNQADVHPRTGRPVHPSRAHGRRPSRSLDSAAEACFAAFDAEIRRKPNYSNNQSVNQTNNPFQRNSRFNSLKAPVVHRPAHQPIHQSTLDRHVASHLTQQANHQTNNQIPALAPTSVWGSQSNNQSHNQWRM